MSINFKKHANQIRKGGLKVFIKKLGSAFYLLIQSPFYLFSIPLLIIIYLLRPWVLIRWHGLASSRIGHFAPQAEFYCCRRDAKINQPSQKCIDVFFWENKYICNKQLAKMIKRSLTVFPAFLMVPFFNINRFFNLFIKKCSQHEIDVPEGEDRDIHNVAHKFNPHIRFNEEEKFKGKKILSEFGLPEDAKFVCLIVRDSAYLDRYKNQTLRDFSYHDYRDCDIDNFLLAAEELANRGYYVFRMGVKVNKPLKSNNPKIIDYANSQKKSSFMDIYLGANCTFCISTACGFDAIPVIFQKPVAFIYMPFGSMQVQGKNDLILTKHHINKENKKDLTISEIFESKVVLIFDSEEYQNNNIELKENTPEEIKDLVTEMDERISGTWKETEEDLLLKKKFWNIFQNNMAKLNKKKNRSKIISKMYNLMCDAINSRFSANFLRNNKDWIQ